MVTILWLLLLVFAMISLKPKITSFWCIVTKFIFSIILETQLYSEIYFGWPYKSCLISQIQPKWRMAGKFMWVKKNFFFFFFFFNFFFFHWVVGKTKKKFQIHSELFFILPPQYLFTLESYRNKWKCDWMQYSDFFFSYTSKI